MERKLKAVIFDLDGVLTSTSKYHAQAWADLATELGVTPPADLEEQVKGISRLASLKIALGSASNRYTEEELIALAEKKNAYYLKAIKGITAKDLYPNVKELFQALKQASIKIALGSASKNSKTVLEQLGIINEFDAIADGFCYKHGKPNPEVFLNAAEMVGAKADECIVVEDAAAGITAALDGYFATVGIGSPKNLGHAHCCVNSIAELNLELLLKVQAKFNFAKIGLEQIDWSANENELYNQMSCSNDQIVLQGLCPEISKNNACFYKVNDTQKQFPNFLDYKIELEGETLDLQQGTLHSLRRYFNHLMQTFSYHANWTSPNGQNYLITQRRFCDSRRQGVVCLRYEIEPLTTDATLRISSDFFNTQKCVQFCEKDYFITSKLDQLKNNEALTIRKDHIFTFEIVYKISTTSEANMIAEQLTYANECPLHQANLLTHAT